MHIYIYIHIHTFIPVFFCHNNTNGTFYETKTPSKQNYIIFPTNKKTLEPSNTFTPSLKGYLGHVGGIIFSLPPRG